jgi:hypothetical protein
MAIVRPGPIIQAISGSVGGVTFAGANARTVLRKKPAPRRRTSAQALQQQERLNHNIRLWQAATDATRAAWNNAAKQYPFTDALGQTYFLSGYTLYLKMRSLPVDFLSRQSYPTEPRTEPAKTFTFNAKIGALGFNCGLTYYTVGTKNVLLYGRRLLREHYVKPKRTFKYLGTWTSEPATIYFEDEWLAALGSPIIDELYQIKAILVEVDRLPSSARKAQSAGF